MKRCAYGKRTRGSQGSMLGMTGGLTFIISTFGLAICFLLELLGGYRELQNATDSGCLNLAQQITLNPGVDLLSNEVPNVDETTEFADAIDPRTKQVNLRTINRVILHALIVAREAAKLGTKEADSHAREVILASKMIQARLTSSLLNYKNGGAKGSSAEEVFAKVARANSLRLLSATGNAPTLAMSDYQVSYMNQDGTGVSNACVDGLGLPASLTRRSSDGHDYVIGYTDIPAGNTGDFLQFVPVQLGAQPHLVSLKDFQSSQKAPATSGKFISGGVPAANPVPPNALLTAAAAEVQKSQRLAVTISCGIIGTAEVPPKPRPYFMRIKVACLAGFPITPAGIYQVNALDPSCVDQMQKALLPSFQILKPTADEEYIKNFFLKNNTIMSVQWNSSSKWTPYGLAESNYYYIFNDPISGEPTFADALPPNYNSNANADGQTTWIKNNWAQAPTYIYTVDTPASGYNGNIADIVFLNTQGNDPQTYHPN